ncbi:23S rRNA (adenine(2503)-C(2))-methyltransferase RlmN [Magnetococcales bacterium HHB-1]
MAQDLIALTDLTREQLLEQVEKWGERPFRAKQLWSWLYVKLADNFDAMTDLAKDFRLLLNKRCHPLRLSIKTHQVAKDGVEKWLFLLDDQQAIETVYIPEEDRGTLCISSQAGCSLNCPFCHTGTQGFARNLTASEIVMQVITARSVLAKRDKRITNLVLMGMGEPLYNYDHVAQAVKIFLDDSGLAIGRRKITLSTVGVPPLLSKVGKELGVNLAISLHAATDDLRNRLVPLNRKYDLAALRQAVLNYPLKGRRRITWEYVMLAGINDRREDALAFIHLLRHIPSKINLIPFNPWPGTPFKPSSMDDVIQFQTWLHKAGFVTVIRDRRGEDIDAACGQLTGKLQGVSKRRIIA